MVFLQFGGFSQLGSNLTDPTGSRLMSRVRLWRALWVLYCVRIRKSVTTGREGFILRFAWRTYDTILYRQSNLSWSQKTFFPNQSTLNLAGKPKSKRVWSQLWVTACEIGNESAFRTFDFIISSHLTQISIHWRKRVSWGVVKLLAKDWSFGHVTTPT